VIEFVHTMSNVLLPPERIEARIIVLRGKRVMIDRDLALLYRVTTSAFNQAVRRNVDRFPDDFMFQMTSTEFQNWKSQFVISKKEKMGLRRRPLVFTEQGVAMLSSVLKSKRAIQVNVQIMRTFSRLREMTFDNSILRRKIESMEQRYDAQFRVVFDAIRNLLSEKVIEKPLIGFRNKKK